MTVSTRFERSGSRTRRRKTKKPNEKKQKKKKLTMRVIFGPNFWQTNHAHSNLLKQALA
jgi:hypothetical protein